MTRVIIVFWLIGLAGLGCERAAVKPKSTAPAVVRNAVEESSLTEVRLTARAEARLGIETERCRLRSLVRTSLVGARLELPPAARISVVSTVRGRVDSAETWPSVCQSLEAGAALFSIQPILNPEHVVVRGPEQFMMADQLATAKARLKELDVQIEAAKIALDRARKLMKGRVGSQRIVDESTASLALLQAGRETARARLRAIQAQLETPSARPSVVKAPADGMLTGIFVKPGQHVVEGAALAEITDLDQLWVRASIYASELSDLEPGASATMQTSERSEVTASIAAVAAPPAADPLTGNVDLVYLCDNTSRVYRPGQRVWLRLPHKTKGPSLSVPHSAVLIDMNGGRWVYQKLAPGHYTRRRVEVIGMHGRLVVIGRGLEADAEVVTVGAPELFGTEFWQR